MTPRLEHIPGRTFHGRRGEGVRHAFAYGVDYVLLDAEDPGADGPRLFSRNRANFASLSDRDHGGPPGEGRGALWVREVLAESLPAFARDLAGSRILLLAQPRILGHVFNPVSFWLIHDADDALRCVIAEVTNTFGDRHCYLCHRDDLGPIVARTELSASKLLHVSPFLPVAGHYTFRFDIRPESIAIRIAWRHGAARLLATLTGPRWPLTDASLLRAAWRRPFGSRRVLGLIHWQALRLWWKGATFRRRPAPPPAGTWR